MPHALIVVRDEDARMHLAEAAREQAFSVSLARSAEAGLTQMETRFPDLLFLDRCFGGRTREAMLDRIRTSARGSAVLVGPGAKGSRTRVDPPSPLPPFLSSLRDPAEAGRVNAILMGVANSMAEPAESPKSRPPVPSPHLAQLRGASPCMERLRHLVARVAPSRASVLICGESGAGKERVARAIHDLSPRRTQPYVAVNCGAISPTLMESEIFGHEKGSFSGASRRHRGLFERADGGTLLLDEITEMPVDLQVKLLRVLESGTVLRVGAESPVQVDVRILATTNRAPQEAIEQGKLRADLYYRLRILEVEVPPLRERLDDLPELAQAVLEEIEAAEGQSKSMGPRVVELLQAYPWPGNVRELRNALYTAFLLSEGPALDVATFPDEISGSSPQFPPPGARSIRIPVETSLREAERQLILMTLAHMEGRKARAAKALGVSLKTLYNRLHSYGYMAQESAAQQA